MKKLLVVAIAVLSMIIILSSCGSYDLCPTYANCSMKSYHPKHTFAHASTSKKAKKNKIW